MKNLFLFSVLIIAYCSSAVAQDSTRYKQRGFLITPVKQGLGLRSNLSKKNFWDYKLRFDLIASPAGSSFYVHPEVAWKHRVINREFAKLYWGLGLQIEYFMPTVLIPIGFEIMPFDKVENVGIWLEAGPQVFFALTYGVRTYGDLGVTWYFDKKKKKRQ